MPDIDHVRPMTEADMDGVLDVLAAVVEEGRWLARQPPLDLEERRAALLESLAGERSAQLVAVGPGGRVVGFLGLEVAPYGVAHFGMCVVADQRGRGVGGALVEAAVEAARGLGAHKVSLQVWPHNGPAIRLYRRHGFVAEGRLRRHYPRRNGELWDAIEMGRVLDEERPGSPYPDED